jgi:hypothetical protein
LENSMAENESLDLADSRRWQSVYHCVRQEKSSKEVGSRVARCLCRGLRVAIKQFAKEGVSIKDLLAARHDPIALRRLVKKNARA